MLCSTADAGEKGVEREGSFGVPHFHAVHQADVEEM
jgi:hypothetical protein